MVIDEPFSTTTMKKGKKYVINLIDEYYFKGISNFLSQYHCVFLKDQRQEWGFFLARNQRNGRSNNYYHF